MKKADNAKEWPEPGEIISVLKKALKNEYQFGKYKQNPNEEI